MHFEEAKRLYCIHSILGTKKRSIVCPLPFHVHYKNTPSFSIYWKDGVQRWKCHGFCNLEGDVIDLVGYLSIPNYNPMDKEKRSHALQELDGYRISFPTPERYAHLPLDAWKSLFPPGSDVVEYGKKRGLTPSTLAHFKVGQKGKYMAIPTFENGALTCVKFRNTRPGTRFYTMKGSRSSLFNHDAVAYKTGTVLVVKAEIPSMLLNQMGYLACAPTGGEGARLDCWVDRFVFFERIVVVGDNDPVGVAGARQRAELLGGETLFPLDQYKDIDEYILAKPVEAKKLLEEIAAETPPPKPPL